MTDSKYKIVLRNDLDSSSGNKPQWTQGCPAMVEAIQVSRNTETSQAYLQLKLRNISDIRIDSIRLAATVGFEEESEQTISLAELDADCAPGNSFECKPELLPYPDVRQVRISVEEIVQGEKRWKRASDPSDFPVPEKLELSQTAMGEREKLLREMGVSSNYIGAIAAHKVVDAEKHWVCSCGQPNVHRDTCCKCGANKQQLQGIEDNTELEQKAAQRANREKAEADAAKAKTKEKAAKRSAAIRRGAIIAGIIAAIAIVAIVVTQVAIPSSKYANAVEAMNAGDYATAIESFEGLGNYKDSESKVSECKEGEYNQAKNLYEQGSYADAYTVFRLIPGYKDSTDMAAQCDHMLQLESDYQDAIAAKDSGDIFYAEGAFKPLADEKYRDSETIYNEVHSKANETRYQYVKDHYVVSDKQTIEYLKALKNENYSDSVALYLNLCGYSVDVFFNDNSKDYSTHMTDMPYETYPNSIWCHYSVTCVIPGKKFELKIQEEGEQGTAGVNYYIDSTTETVEVTASPDGSTVYETYYLTTTGSKVYYHRVTISDAETGETLASAELSTPYSN